MIAFDRSTTDRRPLARSKQNRIGSDDAFWAAVEKSKQIAASLQAVNDKELLRHTTRLRLHFQATENGDTTDSLVLAAAGATEAVRRTLGLTLFDVQLFAGIAVAQGAVAEMQTGEGKTLAGVVPAYFHALKGCGVHVATANEYLAARDSVRLEPVFRSLGLTTGLVTEGISDADARKAYDADITFGPGHVFGFDFLRDQLSTSIHHSGRLGERIYRQIQSVADPSNWGARKARGRGLHAAIIDEIDNVLIDDAVSPLLLSQFSDVESPDAIVHQKANQIAIELCSEDFHLDVATREVTLAPSGFDRVYDGDPIASHANLVRPWHEYVVLALRAIHCFRPEVDYVVNGEEVRIIDASTGRIFSDRTWSRGLHQAILAKHQRKITPEAQTLAKITRQRFFRQYEFLAGMTGTATGCEHEFASVYGMPVVRIPLRNSCKRQLFPDHLCEDENDKWQAIADEVECMIGEGRAVLIGTCSIEKSLSLAECLAERGIDLALLNGIQDADEADIIARAGQSRSVTIATNLAGRGTDIALSPEVAHSGGLHVIQSERHALARVERQLIGRCARCGDPGSARFFVAADEPLIHGHAPWVGRAIRRALRQSKPDRDSGRRVIANHVGKLQTKLEKQAAYRRRQLLQFDKETESLLGSSVVDAREPSACWKL